MARSFERGTALIASVPGDVTRLLSTADRGQGRETLHRAQLPGLLDQLALRARVQSVTASSALEGVVVPDGRRAERIVAGSVSAQQTPWLFDELVERYRLERERDAHHPLLLVGLAVLDLLVIHPFDDGNGRVARILTSALLADAGYGVARCASSSWSPTPARTTTPCCWPPRTAGTRPSTTPGRGCATSSHAWPRPTSCSPSGRPPPRAGGPSVSAWSGTSASRRRRRSPSPTCAPPCRASATFPHAARGRCPHIRNALDDLRLEGRVSSDGTGRGATWTRA